MPFDHQINIIILFLTLFSYYSYDWTNFRVQVCISTNTINGVVIHCPSKLNTIFSSKQFKLNMYLMQQCVQLQRLLTLITFNNRTD